MAHKLPPPIAQWFGNPLFKIILTIIILLVHWVSPVLSILLAIAFLISIQTLSMYQTEDALRKIKPNKKITDDEANQINSEVTEEITRVTQDESVHSKDDRNVLHPINKPTKETIYADSKVMDPNSHEQPGYKLYNDEHIDTAIYELNPPFADKDLPMDQKTVPNKATVNVVEGGPTRYSAYHGYN